MNFRCRGPTGQKTLTGEKICYFASFTSVVTVSDDVCKGVVALLPLQPGCFWICVVTLLRVKVADRPANKISDLSDNL